MKKKIAGRIGAAILAASLMMSMAVPAMAATTYTSVAGTSCTFNKYLIMDPGDSVPNVAFSFTVAPGTAISSDTSDNAVMQVLSGVGTPTIANVTFSPSSTTETSAGTNIDVARSNEDRGGTSNADAVQLDTGEKYATSQVTVDFSSVLFDEPGIYRYIITETASAGNEAAGITQDTDSDRVLDVYVVDDGTGTLAVSEYVLHTNEGNVAIGSSMGANDVQTARSALGDKTDGFTNEMSGRKDLEIRNAVTGNQASRDKYFKYNVKFTGGTFNDDDAFVVSLSRARGSDTMNYGNAEQTPTGNDATIYSEMSNPTDVTGKQLTGDKGVDLYLQNGQYVVIRGLPADAKYTVTENAEDYASAPADGCTNTTGEGTIGSLGGDNKLVRAGFMNTRNGVIPTGIMMAVAPFAVAAVIGGVGLGGMSIRKKKREDEE